MSTTMSQAELAEARRAELDALLERSGGTIAPSAMVEAARDPESALHGLFTWDDSEAAEKWRIAEAQKYLRTQVTVIAQPSAEPIAVRAYWSLPSDRAAGLYRPIAQVLASREMTTEMLEDARREFLSYKRKYGHLEQLRAPLEQLSVALAA
jgi:hypothetical protein